MTQVAPIIPPHIWQVDQPLWKQWMTSIDPSYDTKQTYKQVITRFYNVLELPIQQITEQHLEDYQVYLQEIGKSEHTVRTYMATIRKYWRFVHNGVQV